MLEDTGSPDHHAHRGSASTRVPLRRVKLGEVVQVAVEDLRPTQMAVGMRAVTYKRRRIEERYGRKKLERVLSDRPIPTVRGPGGCLFIIDNHHFGLALWQAEVRTAFAQIIDDCSHLNPLTFYRRMEAKGRLYPFDERGERVAPSRLPTWLHALRHDPYRDLAWSVREAGGFRKVKVPYTEFLWADHFREHIPLSLVRRDYNASIARALKLASSPNARCLPGWIAN